MPAGNVYEIYDTCSDMPHRRLQSATADTAREFVGGDVKEAAEYQVHWACGGKRATEAYLDSAEVREAIHVTPTALRKWGMETDRECCNAGASALHSSAIFCRET